MTYPKFRLTTTPCQYARSKTQKTIDYIKQHLLSSYEIKQTQGIHKMTLVFTNKSLQETVQWKYRLNNQLGNLNVIILSSKKDSDKKKMTHIRDYILDDIKKPDDLPDIIVMCTHKTRIQESITFINSVPPNGRINLTDIGVHKIIFDIMFDEADKGENISYISDFLTNIEKYQTTDIDTYKIESINFITATPLKTFWKKLLQHDIHSLENIDHYIENTTEYEDFETTNENYRSLEDHHKQFIEDTNDNPILYAHNVLTQLRNGSSNKPRIVYAPGASKRSSHEEMKTLFLREGYDVLVINGKHKEFIIQYTRITIEDFNRRHNIKGELRDTLVQYRKLYPNRNLVITGNICIERGVTFNTTGFQFTDSIISSTHSKKIPSLIQFLGRSNGHAHFCQTHTLWIPESIYKKAMDTIKILVDIQKLQPVRFTENDFRKKTKRDIEEVAKTIPISVTLTEKEYDELIKKKKGNQYITDAFQKLVCEKVQEPNLFTYDDEETGEKKSYKQDQISKPETEGSYKRNIIDNIKAYDEQRPFSIAIKKKNKRKNVFQIWLDYKNKNLIVSRYKGTLIKEE